MATSARSLACAALVLAAGAAPAQAPRKLPLPVQKELSELVKACRDAGGKPAKSPGLLVVADLSGDGLPDYVLDQGSFNCEGAASLFSGSGGSHVAAYVGTPDGQAVQAFSTGSFGVKVDRAARPAQLRISVSGPMCGQRVTPKMPHSEYKACWRPVIWNVVTRKLEFAPVSQVELIR